jgi:Rrf2 family iron-sulfur cluster assembly transcriptional regulator
VKSKWDMLLSPKERFAVSAMVDMALQEQVKPVPLSAMSLRLQISRPYLEVIFSQLRQKGLVVSTQGHKGGFSLGRPTHCITFADIIEAVKNKPQAKISAKLHFDQPAMPDHTKELLESLNLERLTILGTCSVRSCQCMHETSPDQPEALARTRTPGTCLQALSQRRPAPHR